MLPHRAKLRRLDAPIKPERLYAIETLDIIQLEDIRKMETKVFKECLVINEEETFAVLLTLTEIRVLHAKRNRVQMVSASEN